VNTTDSRVELSIDLASSSLPERLRDRAIARLAGRLVDGVLTGGETKALRRRPTE
jgi:ribosome-associated protein